jgi:beta-glucosidase
MFSLTPEQEQRIESLLSQMTLEEKVAQLTGVFPSAVMDGDTPSEEKMEQVLARGIGQISLSGGASELPPDKTAENANAIQRFLVEKTRLGIPAIFNDECLAGYVCMGATHFPQAIGMAATWSPDLLRRVTTIISTQARAAGSHLMYSPVLDVARDPRWGRTEETLGEDPYLASRMATAFVQGLQQDDLRKGIISTLKHYVGYSFTEGGRNCAPAHIGPRELREVFLLPFEAAVKEGQAQSVMAAYNEIDGVPCAASKMLLTDILRDEWGFEGLVVADWGVVSMLYTFHHTATDATEAAKQALAAGLDIEIPLPECYTQGLVDAIRRGEFPEELVDRSVRRHLRVKFLLGLFDDPYVVPENTRRVFDIPEQRVVALEAARRSICLLKNEGKLLPLDKGIKSIAVIGPNADNTHRLLGDYSYSVYKGLAGDAVKIVSILEGIKQKAPAETEVIHALGCEVMDGSTEGFAEAVRAAERSDVVIAVVGGKSGLHRDAESGENLDRAELDLPGAQQALLEALHATGKPLVVVLVNGRPLTVEWAAQHADAIVECWLPGEEGGTAVAEVLFGEYNPGGKLPVTLLRTVGQTPTTYNRRPSSFPAWQKYVFTDREPLYPFGHGLSYTQFAYSNLQVTPETVRGEQDIVISLEVANTGDRAGDEVVQLYVHDVVASITRPRRELKGFQRITLQPGEKKRVTFSMPVEMLAFYDVDMNLIVEPGEFEIMVGASSEDIRLEGKVQVCEKWRVGSRTQFLTEVTVTSL